MSQPFRLPSGGVINREKPLTFHFAGHDYQGYEGDTLASALLANGVHMVARGFKYHRPRGILGSGSEDPAAFVELNEPGGRDTPNVRVTEQELYDGLKASAQNCWPSLKADFNAVNDLFSPFLAAGFYNKTFIGPPGSWALFEPFIRRAAGLGRVSGQPDPDWYEHANRHCDVLIAGAGPAGLMAALGAARAGKRVILAEETARPGGRLLSRDGRKLLLDGKTPAAWVDDVVRELAGYEDVLILPRTCVFGYYADNFLGLLESVTDHLPPDARPGNLPRQRLWRVRARQVVLATGAIERPLVFHNNDRPGVMLASAVRDYLRRYAVLPGREAVIFTSNDSGWKTAFALHEAGAKAAAIADVRPDPAPRLKAAAEALGIPVLAASVVTDTRGRHRVSAVRVNKLDGSGGVSGKGEWINCDLLAVSGGWAPNVALFSQSRGQLAFDETIQAYRPGRPWQEQLSAGACNGVFSLRECLEQGVMAGARAAGAEAAAIPEISGDIEEARQNANPGEIPSLARRPRAFVDLQSDVTTKDLALAQREGYRSVEHTKRYTTTGMGPDQGKTSGMNALAVLSGLRGEPVPDIGVTTFRQPFKPVTFGALTGPHRGALLGPARTTPMHAWHEANGALFEPVGDWLRPRVYPRQGESFDEALMRECKAARQAIGALDASTLGKIDIRGPDSREFLNRVYTNAWMKLRPGHCRYGLMLGEDGMVFDDGVTACIADDHFHMTTTTGGAARVMTWLEDYLQTEWPGLEVYLTSVTEQWAVAGLCGPGSAQLAGDLVSGLDPDPENFPFMTFREGHVEGIPVRVFRVSFSGELSYEINIPARYGLWLWEMIMERGASLGVTPYGTEAMHLLRAEKGYIITGQDTDGTVTPHDLRMDWIVKRSADFIGRRSLSTPALAARGRRQLTGLLTEDPRIVLEEGAHVIATPVEGEKPFPVLGHVTSSYFSPNLNRSIALALIKDGGARMGEKLYVTTGGGAPVAARVSETDFLELAREGRI